MSKKKALQALFQWIKEAPSAVREPVRRYHYTDTPEDFSRFKIWKMPHMNEDSHLDRVGPHLGTIDAAHDRWANASGFMDRSQVSLPGDAELLMTNSRIIPLNADESRPFLIDEKIQTEEFLKNLFREEEPDLIRRALSERGYTNLPYINASEDVGSVSSIALPKTLRSAITNKRMYGASPLALLPDAGPDE